MFDEYAALSSTSKKWTRQTFQLTAQDGAMRTEYKVPAKQQAFKDQHQLADLRFTPGGNGTATLDLEGIDDNVHPAMAFLKVGIEII